MTGAGILSAHGALRAGAGLVTLAVPRSQQIAAAKHLKPEAMTLGLPETSSGSFALSAVPAALDFMEKRRITSLVIGPGLSRHPQTRAFVRKLLPRLPSVSTLEGIVLDADGFLALSGTGILKKMKIPVVALVSTNTNPEELTYPVPGNDLSPSSISWFLEKIEAVLTEAKISAALPPASPAPSAPEK